MTEEKQLSDTLQDIKQMMERSSRFISLSGLSGIAAGICALIGAWFAQGVIANNPNYSSDYNARGLQTSPLDFKQDISIRDFMGDRLFWIGLATFAAALVTAFFFTYLRSRKTNIPIWGATARKLTWNVGVPMLTGAIFLWKMIETGVYGLIAPGCLIFYGLALVNASKFTLNEIKYLGYGQLVTGILNLWFIGQGLWFWAFGFGILHIAYGAIMWWKYEKVVE